MITGLDIVISIISVLLKRNYESLLLHFKYLQKDSFILGINPDYFIEVREDILEEKDGPMLQHGLKDLHKSQIILPSSQNLWPNRELIDRRYQKFKEAI